MPPSRIPACRDRGLVEGRLGGRRAAAPQQPAAGQILVALRPHVIGVVADSLPWWRQLIENELNSANDNPLIDGEEEHVMHGGHFYGGHIAMAMDSMKAAVANLADLLDRQLAQLVDSKFNGGLPSNLSGAPDERQMINHGFKAVQIGVSAWTAEALKQTMPASVFSRSTECHNQDKVSMGTIAARDALRVLTLTEQVAPPACWRRCRVSSCVSPGLPLHPPARYGAGRHGRAGAGRVCPAAGRSGARARAEGADRPHSPASLSLYQESSL